jgi:(4-O-methyl)-D-glucuronate---lignin esterase
MKVKINRCSSVKFAGVLIPTLLLAGSIAWAAEKNEPPQESLAKTFQSPSDDAQCAAYWYWQDKTCSRQAISQDLSAMREQGIKVVIVFPFDNYLKPEWPALFQHVLEEAKRLKLEIILNNDVGWSCKVPWMTPELSMKKLVYTTRVLAGGRHINCVLDAAAVKGEKYGDVVVLACPARDATAASPADIKAAAEENRFKAAVSMFTTYPAGGLDVFYKRPAGATPESIQPSEIIDITSKMQPDGSLDWEAPPGSWIVLRFGYTSTRNKDGSRSPDFFSRKALDYHLGQMIDKLALKDARFIGQQWTHVHEDSYENGQQTWTPGFRDEFRRRRGYDMTPWMPALEGQVIGSRALSDRFLHDYRETISDLYVENHFEYFAQRLEGMGLKFSTEGGYGWASAIADGLRIEACAEMPMGEAWHAQRDPITGKLLNYQFEVHHMDPKTPLVSRALPYGFGLNSVRLAASAAHIYGKPFCQAETFTSYTKNGGYDLYNPPFSVKATADRAFCDGLGRVVFHAYSLQPAGDDKPGWVWNGVGMQFNRNITWWSMAHAFTKYLSRCQLMLRQGKFVADFAYWTGDTMPYECPDRIAMRPALPAGCNADLVNTDVLMNRMTVKAGRLVLPDGISYRYLVLPPTRDTVAPESLRKILELVKAGATVVLGPRPVSAAGLQNYPQCDADVKALADELWGPTPVSIAGQRALGRGRVVWGHDLADLLAADGVPQDFGIEGSGSPADFDWIHYSAGETDIYFISNQSDTNKSVEAAFRVKGKQPELWDPVTGTRRILPEYSVKKDTAVVPLQLAARQSFFLVFHPVTAGRPRPLPGANFPAMKTALELDGGWEVSFDPKWGGPAKVEFNQLDDWSQRPEAGIKFYSGKANYRKIFDLPKSIVSQSKKAPVYLDLGVVKDIAEVRLNGMSLGIVWCAPWRVDISSAIKENGNILEIDVINQWPNRLIGDSRLPTDIQFTKSNSTRFKPDDALAPSGLLGPVTLQTWETAPAR